MCNVTSVNYRFRNEPVWNISAECGIRFEIRCAVVEAEWREQGHAARQQTFKSLEDALYVRGKHCADGGYVNGILWWGVKTM